MTVDPFAPDESLAAGRRFVRRALSTQPYVQINIQFSPTEIRTGWRSFSGEQAILAAGPAFNSTR